MCGWVSVRVRCCYWAGTLQAFGGPCRVVCPLPHPISGALTPSQSLAHTCTSHVPRAATLFPAAASCATNGSRPSASALGGQPVPAVAEEASQFISLGHACSARTRRPISASHARPAPAGGALSVAVLIPRSLSLGCLARTPPQTALDNHTHRKLALRLPLVPSHQARKSRSAARGGPR